MNVVVEKTGDRAIHLGDGTEYIPYIIIKGEKYINLDYKKE